ncbi:MAG: STT3 domain-containing protein [Campylobacterales bacterium]
MAFAFSFILRLYWVYIAGENPSFIFEDELMMNTNDGYFFAEGARDLEYGNPTLSSPMSQPLSILTYMLYKITPFSFNTLYIYMPIFFSSLIVVPLVLIGREFGSLKLGFVAALLASITNSYYNRTMAGYFDTDMLIIPLATFGVYFYLKALKDRDALIIFLASLVSIVSMYYYPNFRYLFSGFLGVFLLFYIFSREYRDRGWLLALASLFIATAEISPLLKLVAVIFIFFAHKSLSSLEWKKSAYLATAMAMVFLLYGFASTLLSLLGNVHVQDGVVESLNLNYLNVINTIRETNAIPFSVVAERISGHVVTFIISSFGVLLLALYDRRFLIFAPLLALGFFTFSGGLRFTIYAIPPYALGFGFIALIISLYIAKNFKLKKLTHISTLSVFTLLALYPNIEHIRGYLVPTVFSKNEVLVLKELGEFSSSDDFVLSWWDYGYPIRYYSKANTFIDGGSHTGSANFPVAYAFLTESARASASIGKLYMEYKEPKDSTQDKGLSFSSLLPSYMSGVFSSSSEKSTSGDFMTTMMKKYGYEDPYLFLDALKLGMVEIPHSDRELYYLLPFRMLEILPTVYRFAQIDLLSGEVEKNSFFYMSERFRNEGSIINLGSGIALDQSSATLQIGENTIKIKRYTNVTHRQNSTDVDVKNLYRDSNISLVYLRSFDAFLVVSEDIYNSMFFKMFVLDKYDSEYFERVIFEPMMKVYRVR